MRGVDRARSIAWDPHKMMLLPLQAGVVLVRGETDLDGAFSQRRRHCVRGIDRARSIAWDPHKMMLLPLQAGMVLVRDERALDGAFVQRAPYLFHGAGDERVLDQGIRSFLCSRRADVIKVWVALQRYGANGMGALYDRLCDTAAAMYDAIKERPRFEAMHEPACNILCFRWLGDRAPDDPALDEANRVLRERYNRSGDGWITTTMLDGRRVLRVTIMNPRTTPDDAVAVLDSLERMATSVRAPS
jgi:L-2,4-diaminobutyrate decarboxylase